MGDITAGSLTARLNQFENSILTAFTGLTDQLGSANVHLATIAGILLGGDVEGRDSLKVLTDAIGSNTNYASIQYILWYALFGDNYAPEFGGTTDFVSVINTLANDTRRMRTSLDDVKPKVVSIEDQLTVNLGEAVNQLTAISRRLDGEGTDVPVNEWLKRISDGLGTTGATTTLAQFLNQVAQCVCELNAKTPAPEQVFPVGFSCVPATAQLMFVITPGDRFHEPGDTQLRGCPTQLVSGNMVGWTIEPALTPGGYLTRLMHVGSEAFSALSLIYVTSDSTTNPCNVALGLRSALDSQGIVLVTGPTSASGADSVSNTAFGCSSMTLPTAGAIADYMDFSFDFTDPTDDTATFYFYVNPLGALGAPGETNENPTKVLVKPCGCP